MMTLRSDQQGDKRDKKLVSHKKLHHHAARVMSHLASPLVTGRNKLGLMMC
jgi:hypothetical protein